MHILARDIEVVVLSGRVKGNIGIGQRCRDVSLDERKLILSCDVYLAPWISVH